METALWAYLWDLADVGLEQALEETLTRAAAGGLSVATAYRAGHLLSARTCRKVRFLDDGTLYFRPDPARYAGGLIQPAVASVVAEGDDPLARLAAKRDEMSFGLHGWTVCLHNSRIGAAYPAMCTENAFGDRNLYSLCPSQPEVRRYLRSLVADLTHRYPLDSVELEAVGFMGFKHGYHHEKDGVGLTEWGDLLFSLCFCPACLAEAERAGVDGEDARAEVRRMITAICERAVPEPDEPLSLEQLKLRAYPVYEYLLWREGAPCRLVAELKAAAAPATRVHVLCNLAGGGLKQGIDVAAAARASDGVIIPAYGLGPGAIAGAVAEARAAAGPNRYVGVGLRVFYPEVTGAEALRQQAMAAMAAGADGIRYYNYGLIPAARLDWIGEANRSLRR